MRPGLEAHFEAVSGGRVVSRRRELQRVVVHDDRVVGLAPDQPVDRLAAARAVDQRFAGLESMGEE